MLVLLATAGFGLTCFAAPLDTSPTNPIPAGKQRTIALLFDDLTAPFWLQSREALRSEAHRRGWGHSHWREAVNVVMESGAKELVLFHHDPEHTDAIIDKVVHEARNYYPKVRAAAEGMEIKL